MNKINAFIFSVALGKWIMRESSNKKILLRTAKGKLQAMVAQGTSTIIEGRKEDAFKR
jgi:hypothetical protein